MQSSYENFPVYVLITIFGISQIRCAPLVVANPPTTLCCFVHCFLALLHYDFMTTLGLLHMFNNGGQEEMAKT